MSFDYEINADASKALATSAKVEQSLAQIEGHAKLVSRAMDTITIGDAPIAKTHQLGDEFKRLVDQAGKSLAMQRLGDVAREVGASLESASGGAFKMGDAMLGLQIAGPVGAVVGGFAGAIKDAGFNIDFATRMINKMSEGVRDYRTVIAEGIAAQNKVNDSFRDTATVVQRAREELEKYNAVQFARSPQGSAVRGFTGGVMGREADKPKAAAAAAAKEWFDDRELRGLTDEIVRLMEAEQLAADEGERLALALALKPDDSWPETIRNISAAEKEMEALAESVKKVDDATKKLSETQQLVADIVKSTGTSFADQLVDAANGAGQSWSAFVKSTLIGIEKMIARALILKALTGSMSGAVGADGNYGGIIGAIFGGGFATGGTFTAPSTAGGPDSIPVLFRMNPRETATFTPDGQMPGGAPATAASSPVMLNVIVEDTRSRSLLRGPADARRVVLDDIAAGRYRGQLRR